MTVKSSFPLIGITLDSEDEGRYSKLPWYALRQNYCNAVHVSGGLPVALPHLPERVSDYLDRIDGLVVTGGAFDVDPVLFGATSRHVTVTLKEQRTCFELAVVNEALERDIPILGICGGQQLLNVALGGSLIQHIPDFVPDALAHEQSNPRTEAGHMVTLVPGTLLHDIVSKAGHPVEIPVNSAHHQAVDAVAPGTVVSARASDGVIEAIEAVNKWFCIGVQWHPEYFISPADNALFAAFIERCRR